MDGTTALLRLAARVSRDAGRSWVHERILLDGGWRERVDEQVKLVRPGRGRLLCFTSELLYGRELIFVVLDAAVAARPLPTMAAPVQVPCRITAGCPSLNPFWAGIRDNLKENTEEAGARQETGKLTNVEHNLYATPS
ncbi:uncharacterized protein P884DRAFT_277593 [Thermothelomyces heterothallicus CBS 202.75]|uniref:uncharacterized protein n=1 Tax=Thermothelomyces heterothallicus CBS 202.75 TaxID=1149848 RepID=UPI003742338C